jgi:HD-like signal output (HDOD) protein
MPTSLTSEEFSRKVSEQIRFLPSLPDTALKLRQILADPNCDFADLISPLEHDAGLCADLIRLANSSFYGRGGRVDTISEAVMTLGMVNLSDFVLVAYTNRIVRSQFACLQNLADYFTHSNKVAGAAYCIAKAAGASIKDQEVCRLGGLLHNIGRLVIAVASEQWTAALGNFPAQGLAGENRFDGCGLDECEVGMRVCRNWNFTEALALGIGRHHSPVKGGEVNYLALIIYLAEFLIIETLPLSIVIADFDPALLDRLQMQAAVLTKAREDYLEGMGKIESIQPAHRGG